MEEKCAAVGDARESPGNIVCSHEGIDPAEAAAFRATERKKNLDKESQNETGFLADVTEAEETYETPSELFNGSGVPIEPFHLKREREEGYFDEAGCYVVHKLDQVRDAWLDAVDRSEIPQLPNTHITNPPDETEVDQSTLIAFKRRMIGLLNSGETALDGLRRFGSSPKNNEEAERKLVGKREALSKKQKRVPEENREKFEKLTEYSSMLMACGECGIYSMTREDLVKEVGEPDDNTEEASTANTPPSTSMSVIRQIGPSSNNNGSFASNAAQDIDMENSTHTRITHNNSDNVDNGHNVDNVDDVEMVNVINAVEGSGSGSGSGEGPSLQPVVNVTGNGGDLDLDGYVFDAQLGYYYNTDAGYYYDPKTDGYGDAATGIWYKYRDGQLVMQE